MIEATIEGTIEATIEAAIEAAIEATIEATIDGMIEITTEATIEGRLLIVTENVPIVTEIEDLEALVMKGVGTIEIMLVMAGMIFVVIVTTQANSMGIAIVVVVRKVAGTVTIDSMKIEGLEMKGDTVEAVIVLSTKAATEILLDVMHEVDVMRSQEAEISV